jgi:hypothetical protein
MLAKTHVRMVVKHNTVPFLIREMIVKLDNKRAIENVFRMLGKDLDSSVAVGRIPAEMDIEIKFFLQ